LKPGQSNENGKKVKKKENNAPTWVLGETKGQVAVKQWYRGLNIIWGNQQAKNGILGGQL